MRGFTLIEMILSISLITLLVGISAPVSIREFQRNTLRETQQYIEDAIITAQTRAMSQYEASNWGVEVTSSSIIVFLGDTFVGRDQQYDLAWDIPNSVTPTGTTSYVFNSNSFRPHSAGTTTLISINGDSIWIAMSQDGVISVE